MVPGILQPQELLLAHEQVQAMNYKSQWDGGFRGLPIQLASDFIMTNN